jgi:hypothetical protein
MGGVFLPSLGTWKKADLRIEAASNKDFSGGGNAVWYRHEASNEGYAHRYRGQVLGHHMGTEARDLFVEAHYFLLPSSYLEVNADYTERFFPGPATEEAGRVSAGMIAWLTRNLRMQGSIAYEKVKNEAGSAGADTRDASLQMSLAYQYR